MSINNSYFSGNNNLIINSYSNTGRNPVAELTFGFGSTPISTGSTNANGNYTRFIFKLDISLLLENISGPNFPNFFIIFISISSKNSSYYLMNITLAR